MMRKGMTAREREVMKRCIVLMLGSIFFFMMAAIRAWSGDYYGHRDAASDPWAFPEEEDYDVMSDDDHMLASRLQRVVVGSRPVYHRRKASRIHDSVTIVVNEDTQSEIASSNDLKRDSSNNIGLTNWVTLGGKQRGAASGGATPSLEYSAKRKHKSDSSIERSQTLTTTLTGEVIEVHPNGYLVIEARKSVNINGEEQTVTVTGIVNPAHMDSNSSVKAEYIMDMAVRYTGTGPMTRMDKRGWGSKIIDFINPF